MKTIRILQIVPNMQQGGLENFIMNLYRNINREKIQFDFLVHYKKNKYFDDEIEELGGKIYRFTLREDNNIFKYIVNLNSFFKKHKEYKVIHCHMSSIGFIVFFIAKLNGIEVRIAHSHNSNTEKTLKGFIKSILMKPYKYFSNVNFACSQDAGKYLFRNKKFEVIPNSIDVEKFKFNKEKRKEIREKYNIDNDFVIGHIGRFNIQKNHDFLIDIFNEIVKEKLNAKLLLIGTGELESKIKEKIEILKIKDKVLFLGTRNNTNDFYQAMDCFVLPSFFEGLPVVGVEAQASGLPCVFSDEITPEIKINNNIKFVSLKECAKQWAKEINEISSDLNRERYYKTVQSIYGIEKLKEKMERKYINLYNNKGEK